MINKRMPKRFKRSMATLLLSAAISSTAFAQDTGSLRVRLVDASGNPVAGATVNASTSESLQSRTVVSGADGEAVLLGLDPSTLYEVSVEGSGYQSMRDEGVTVVAGRSFVVEYDMTRAANEITEIVVTGGSTARIVDTTSALVSTDVTLELTESLPTGRSYQSYLQLAPSTLPTIDGNAASKSGVNYSDAEDSNGNVAGSSTDNVYFIDGVNVTDNVTGTFGANFNSEIIQQQQILTGGVPAEYEGGQGLVSRVITKSGSNEWHGSLNYYSQDDSLVADNDNLEDATFSTFDTAFTLGGPIIKDKLWVFGSFQLKEREEDVIDPVTGTLLRTVNTEQDLGFLKMTWAPTENDNLVVEWFNDPYTRDGSNRPDVTSLRDESREQGGDNYKVGYTHYFGNLSLTLDWTQHEGELNALAASNITRNDVAFLGYDATNAETDLGGKGTSSLQYRDKEELSITGEYFWDTNWGTHNIKASYKDTENERGVDAPYTGDGSIYTSIGAINSGVSLDTYANDINWVGDRDISEDDYARILTAMNNAPNYLALLDTSGDGDISDAELSQLRFDSGAGNPGGHINTYRIAQTVQAPVTYLSEGTTWYVQDSWNIDEHWTINAGVRSEEWDHIASDGTKIFTFDSELAPRLSVVYDIFGDGRSKVWGFTGRYYDPVRTDMTRFAGTLTGSVREEQVYVDGDWLTFRTRGGAQGVDGYFSPTTKTPYTDEWLIGYEYAINQDQSFTVTYTDRVTEDIMEDYDLATYVESEGGSAGGYSLPLSYFGFTENPGSNYVIATLEGGSREYKGYEFSWRKRKGDDNWQAGASYVYNDAEGNTNSDGNADLQGDFLYLDPRAPNTWGTQAGSIKHVAKAYGSYTFNNGIELGAVYAWNSGLTYSTAFKQYSRHTPLRVDEAYDSLGANSRWLAPGGIGGNESPSYGTLDFRAKYRMDIFDFDTEFFLDIFNVLDDQAEIRTMDLYAGDGIYDFGEASAWVQPRRMYLGVRTSF